MKILDRVNKYIIEPHVLGDRARWSHYPSEASVISRTDGTVIGKCHRATWYSWKKEKPTNPIDARGMWTMNFGKQLEGMYVKYIKELGIWAANNVKYYDPLRNISGEIDVFVFDKPKITSLSEAKRMEFEGRTPSLIGIEIKSAYGYGFQKKIKIFPKLENLLQVALYIDHWKKPWKLIYHSRDTMENIEYNISMLDGHIYVEDIPVKVFHMDDVYDRYKQLGEYVVKNELPPRDFTYGYDLEQSQERCKRGTISKTKLSLVKNQKGTDSDWQCLYCSYLNKCWADKRKALI